MLHRLKYIQLEHQYLSLILLMIKITTEKISGYKSQGTDQICAQMIQPDGKQLYSEIHELPSPVWNKVGPVVAQLGEALCYKPDGCGFHFC